MYRLQSLVGRLINRLKQFRRVVTRPTVEIPDREKCLNSNYANRIPGSVMISIGEEDSQWPEIRSGQRPISEYFVLRCIFEHTFTVKQWWSHAPGSMIW